MKTYKILRTILLGFQTHNDQYDVLIDPGEGKHLEVEGSTIWFVNAKGRHESITEVGAIENYLRDGYIEEITT